MVSVRPFKALMFDLDEVQAGAGQVTSPPYDIISPEEKSRLKKASEYNVTHLTLPSPAPGKEEETKYQEANKLLKRWRKEGVVYQRSVPSFFVYEVTYEVGGRSRSARGLMCLLALDPDYSAVRPHERTHKGPIEDRLELLKATAVDLEPIQFLYRDPQGEVMDALAGPVQEQAAAPMMDFMDHAGSRHVLWPVTDPEVLERVSAWFADKRVYIADGHHRYATALAYADWRRENDATEGKRPRPYAHKLSVLMEAGDPGLSVHPTHRLVQLADVEEARRRLGGSFPVEPLPVEGDAKARAATIRACLDEAASGEHRFVFDWGAGACDVLKLRHEDVPASMEPERSEAWRRLDVSVLHHLVLPGTLGVTAQNAGESLRYTRDAVEAVAAVLQGEADCAVLMNPTPQEAVLQVADAMEHMPQKSTYFLPKLQSGMLFSTL